MSQETLYYVTRNPVFGVCNQVRLKQACSATETSYGLEVLAIASRDITLSKQRTTKVLIRLHGCAGWSAALLFACGKSRFSHDVAQFLFLNVFKGNDQLTLSEYNAVSIYDSGCYDCLWYFYNFLQLRCSASRWSFLRPRKSLSHSRWYCLWRQWTKLRILWPPLLVGDWL